VVVDEQSDKREKTGGKEKSFTFSTKEMKRKRKKKVDLFKKQGFLRDFGVLL